MSKQPRKDWKMPEPPSDDMYPCAIDSGDGWVLFWGNEDGDGYDCNPSSEHFIHWPFEDDDMVGYTDLEAAGFECV